MKSIFQKAEHLGLSLLVATGLGGFSALAHGYHSSSSFNYPSKSVIRQAQDELRDEGYYSGSINGFMGPQMRRALRQYQRVNNLNVNGRLDQATISSLGVTQGQVSSGEASRAVEEPYLSKSTIKQAQQQLKSNGDYMGAIDGRAGPRTRSALRHYQQKNNLQVTGMLDHETLQKMGLSSSNQYNPN
jgi:peptidoglycan DL-endopeptidase LytF